MHNNDGITGGDYTMEGEMMGMTAGGNNKNGIDWTNIQPEAYTPSGSHSLAVALLRGYHNPGGYPGNAAIVAAAAAGGYPHSSFYGGGFNAAGGGGEAYASYQMQQAMHNANYGGGPTGMGGGMGTPFGHPGGAAASSSLVGYSYIPYNMAMNAMEADAKLSAATMLGLGGMNGHHRNNGPLGYFY